MKPDRELCDRLVMFLAHGKEVSEQPASRREYHRAVGPSRDIVYSAILEASISATESRCVEWLAYHVDMKAQMYADLGLYTFFSLKNRAVG